MVTWSALTVLFGVVAVMLMTRFRIGAILSPASLSILMIVAIFGVRPLLIRDLNDFNFYGYDAAPGAEAAARIGFLALLALIAGYVVAATRKSNANTASAKVLRGIGPRTYHAYICASLLLLATWLGLSAAYGGGLSYISEMFAGRSSSLKATYVGVPAIVFALPVTASLLLVVGRVRLSLRQRLSAIQKFAYWCVLFLCLVPPSALGNRRFMIPTIIGGLVGAFAISWNKKVKGRHVCLAVGGFLVLSMIPFVRSAGSRTQSKDLFGALIDYWTNEGIRGTLEGFFLSYDTEMFSYVAVLSERLGSSLEYGWGRGIFGESFLAIFPAAHAPGIKWSDQLLMKLFGGTCADQYCPVPSIVGTAYFDFGVAGIIAIMGLVGYFAGRYSKQARVSGFSGFPVWILVLSAFVPVIVRGNPISQLWIAAQCIVVIYVIDLLLMKLTYGFAAPTRVLVQEPGKRLHA